MKKPTTPHRWQQNFLRRFCQATQPLLSPTGRVVVACSGGSDSVALTHLLHQSQLLPPQQCALAHFDHRLRPESTAEGEWVAQWAEKLGWSCFRGAWQEAGSQPGNLSNHARQARYAFLLQSAHTFGSDRLLTAHHLDDQAETFIDRLFKGSGIEGLAAMSPLRPLDPQVAIVRPLLSFQKDELLTWLHTHKLFWHEDASNRSMTQLRNRIRHQLIPCMHQVTHIQPATTLAQTAMRMREANQALDWTVDRLWQHLDLQQTNHTASLSWQAVALLPDELARRILMQLRIKIAGETKPLSRTAIHDYFYMLHSPKKVWQLRLSGITLARQGELLIFTLPQGRFY